MTSFDFQWDILSEILSFVRYDGFDWLHIKLVSKKWNEVGKEVFNPGKGNAIQRLIRWNADESEFLTLLGNKRVDPSERNNMLIRYASEKGYLAVVKKLLKDPRVSPIDANSSTIRFICMIGELDLFEVIMNDPQMTTEHASAALGFASKFGNLDIVNRILGDIDLDSSAGYLKALSYATENGDLEMIERLFADERITDHVLSNSSFLGYARSRETVDRMLNFIDPSAGANIAIYTACQRGNLEAVERLLEDERVDPSAHNNCALEIAIHKFHWKIVVQLLKDPRIGGAVGNEVLVAAASYNRLEIVEILLDELKIDPSENYNLAIQVACTSGCLQIVNKLLEDKRVDPSDDQNQALRLTCARGHILVLERLLQDDRVDPSDVNNDALKKARSRDIVNLLKNDPRFRPS